MWYYHRARCSARSRKEKTAFCATTILLISTQAQQELRKSALQIGFADLQFIVATSPDAEFQSFYNRYLDENLHADLDYLANTTVKFDPKFILAGVKAIGVFAHAYRHRETEHELKNAKYKIARYAWGRDYHKTLRSKMKKVMKTFNARMVVDSTPLPERYFARKAGIGKIGRNGMLIREDLGSWFLLSFALLEEPIEVQETRQNEPQLSAEISSTCGTCRACVEACPTQALLADGRMDTSRCISYATIERPGHRIQESKKHRWVFGCDICQNVCPYNRGNVGFTSEEDFKPRKAALAIANGELTALQAQDWLGTPLRRAGSEGLAKNID
ncbi:MAG: tRNA epoxyqueuosine(34) reductase QueG, partial [Leptospiraceae bacterium]|nr:tRNA epoxyqueuosine(34) reductase QueG [Leptospiraceae bacterium]